MGSAAEPCASSSGLAGGTAGPANPCKKQSNLLKQLQNEPEVTKQFKQRNRAENRKLSWKLKKWLQQRQACPKWMSFQQVLLVLLQIQSNSGCGSDSSKSSWKRKQGHSPDCSKFLIRFFVQHTQQDETREATKAAAAQPLSFLSRV